MTDQLLLKHQLLQNYLQTVYQHFSQEALDNLKVQDPTYFDHIQKAEAERSRLDELIRRAEQEKSAVSEPKKQGKPQQLSLNFEEKAAVLPPPPKQSTKQKLNNTTIWTPLPSIVEEGYDKVHTGINWPHYENMLKLFALGFFVKDAMTQQQQKDKEDLTRAIEACGNARYKRKHLTAEEIIKRDSKVYMNYGKNVIRAMAEPNPWVSERRLKDLRSEIPDTRNDQNAIQLHKMMSKAKTIYMTLQARYNQK